MKWLMQFITLSTGTLLAHSMLVCSSSSLLLCCKNLRISSSIVASLYLPKNCSSISREYFSSTYLLSSPCYNNSFCSSAQSRFLSFSSSFSFPSAKPLFYRSGSASTMASQSGKTQESIHDFTVKDAKGNDVDLSQYKGKVLLIVNVASQCGLTNSNYTELNQLYHKYKNQGLEILAFPCNQFGGQEPGDNEQIQNFVCTRFKAEFPIFDKVEVNGENADPIYKFMKSSKGGLLGNSIKWNFSKFLVDKEGHVIDRYAPTTSPLSIEKDIKKLLGVS